MTVLLEVCGFESEEFKATFKWHRTNFRPDEKYNRTLHWHRTVVLTSQVEFSPLSYAQSNSKWRLLWVLRILVLPVLFGTKI